MFAIKDLTNPREFIAKLNSKLSNFFDGKYSSLSGVPTEFPPEEHAHDIVPNSALGFLDANSFLNLHQTCCSTPTIADGWFYNFHSAINLYGYANLYCTKLGYDFNRYSEKALNHIVPVDLHLFSHNVVVLNYGSSSPGRLSFALDMSEIEAFHFGADVQFQRYLEQYYLSGLNLPPIYVPITIIIPNINIIEREEGILWGTLSFNSIKLPGAYKEYYFNVYGFDTEKESLRFQTEWCPNSYINYYFGDATEIQIGTYDKYVLRNRGYDFHKETTIKDIHTTLLTVDKSYDNIFDDYLIRTIHINGYLKLTKGACTFYSL